MQWARAEQVEGFDALFAAYQRLNAQYPNYARGWYETGVGMVMKGRIAEALACFDRASALDPDDPVAYDHKAVALCKHQRFDEAVAAVDTGLRRCPRSGRLHSRRGISVALRGDAKAAVSDFQRSIEVDPEYIEAWAYKADAEVKSGQSVCAIDSINQYLVRCQNPRLKMAVAARRQLFALENPGRTIDHETAQRQLAGAFGALRAGSPSQALSFLHEGLRANPLSPELWFNTGACLMMLSRADEALAAYHKAEALGGLDDTVLEGLVPCLLALGRPDEALACCDRAIAFQPHADVPTLLKKARLLCELGRHGEALPLYERAVRKSPTDVSVVAERARALVVAGQLPIARFAYDAALELTAHDRELQAARAVLGWPEENR